MIKDYIEKLLTLNDSSLTKIAFIHEPLKNLMTEEQMLCLEKHSKEYGRLLASSVKGKYAQIPMVELISLCGCVLKELSTEPDVDYALFAYFEKSDRSHVVL